ncbi:MAG: hypothetical protein JSS04_06360 [Proteobacteria bacterium]|nr:hypothetical protein [Pseudomonadota bacterium]
MLKSVIAAFAVLALSLTACTQTATNVPANTSAFAAPIGSIKSCQGLITVISTFPMNKPNIKITFDQPRAFQFLIDSYGGDNFESRGTFPLSTLSKFDTGAGGRAITWNVSLNGRSLMIEGNNRDYGQRYSGTLPCQ